MRRFIFIHLPKTAGTSFHDALCRVLGGDVSPLFLASHLSEAEAENLDRYRVISGHISLTDIENFFPDRSIISILRDPIDRCVSWYYFAKVHVPADEMMPDVYAAQHHGVDEFFALDSSITYRNIYNRQTRQLGDHVLNQSADHRAALERAKRVLDSAAWIGLQDNLSPSLVDLGRRFPEFDGIEMQVLHLTPGRRPVEQLSDATLANVRRLNEFDLELYRYATQLLSQD